MNTTNPKTIRTAKIEKLFFALFLLSIPIQTRLTFFTSQTYQNGSFNEYATFFLYLSDVLFITTLLLYFVNTLTFWRNYGLIKTVFHTYPRLIPTFTLLITFVTWSFLTTFWSEAKNIAFYQSIKLLELALLFFYIRARLQWFGYIKLIFIFFIAGFFESIIGIGQYYHQGSLGLKFLMESVISPETPNVAKIIVDGEKIIRAYGTFPHPNVFSGFLLFSIFCGLYLLFAHDIVSRETISTKNKTSKIIMLYFLIIGIVSQATALILTYSRSAWFVSIIIFISFIVLMISSKLFYSYRPELTDKKNALKQNKFNEMFHVKHLKFFCQIIKQSTSIIVKKANLIPLTVIVIPLIIIININWAQIGNRTTDGQNKYRESVDNRILYTDIALNMLKKYPTEGIGAKNYTIQMQKFTNEKLKTWQFQPVHNIFLLIASEMGLIGLAIFLLFIYSIFKPLQLRTENLIVSRETIYTVPQKDDTILNPVPEGKRNVLYAGLLSVLIGFMVIELFDHYFWTLQQGQLAFWSILGIIASLKK